MLHLARTVTSDASALVNGTLRLELDDELATARDVLTTSDVVTTIACATVSAGATSNRRSRPSCESPSRMSFGTARHGNAGYSSPARRVGCHFGSSMTARPAWAR